MKLLKCLPVLIILIMVHPNLGLRWRQLRSNPYKSLDQELEQLLHALDQRRLYNRHDFGDLMKRQLETIVQYMEYVQVSDGQATLTHTGSGDKFYPWGG